VNPQSDRVFSAIWNIWLQLSPWLLLGALTAGVLHVLVPDGWLKKHLSGRGGVLKAVAIGIPLPLCSCGVIPVGLGLRKEGASSGAAVGFLISTPQTGVDSVLVSGTLLGWPFAVLKLMVALVTGLVGGLLANLGGGTQEVSTDGTADQTAGPTRAASTAQNSERPHPALSGHPGPPPPPTLRPAAGTVAARVGSLLVVGRVSAVVPASSP